MSDIDKKIRDTNDEELLFSIINEESLIDTSEAFLNEFNTSQNDEVPALLTSSDSIDKLNFNYSKAKGKIEKNFDYLNNFVNRRKAHLLKKLDKIYEKKASNLKSDKKNENELIDFSVDLENEPEAADIKSCNSLKQIIKLVSKFGQIISTEAVEANCKLSGEGLMQCFINEDASFTLSCRDINNNLTKTHSSFLRATIDSIELDPQIEVKCTFEYSTPLK